MMCLYVISGIVFAVVIQDYRIQTHPTEAAEVREQCENERDSAICTAWRSKSRRWSSPRDVIRHQISKLCGRMLKSRSDQESFHINNIHFTLRTRNITYYKDYAYNQDMSSTRQGIPREIFYNDIAATLAEILHRYISIERNVSRSTGNYYKRQIISPSHSGRTSVLMYSIIT